MATVDASVFPFATRHDLDGEPEYAALRESDPVPKVELITGGEAVLATRYADVRTVFGDPAFSRAETGRPGVPSLLPNRRMLHLLDLDPPGHTRVRRLVAHAFTMRATERMRGPIEEIAETLIDGMVATGPPVDFVTSFAMRLPATVMSTVLGVPEQGQDRLWGWMDAMMSISSLTPEQLKAQADNLFGYLTGFIAHKRTQPADDLVTRLIEASADGDRLSEQEVLVNTFLLIAGGYETTANLLSNAILTLDHHPEQLAMLRADPGLLPAAVEELLRYVRISHCATERVAVRDTDLGGRQLPAGTVVIPLQYSANRDPDFVSDPDRFDVTRPPAQHLAFGHGAHHCLGAPLARLELHTALGALLRRLPALRPAIAHTEVRWKTGMLTRGPLALPVTW